MANVCNNIFYVQSDNKQNLTAVMDFLNDHYSYYDCDYDDDSLDIYFESKWVFPEELMQELFESLPDKSDIYMRCLSYEFGCMYHALWYCDEDGWHEA